MMVISMMRHFCQVLRDGWVVHGMAEVRQTLESLLVRRVELALVE